MTTEAQPRGRDDATGGDRSDRTSLKVKIPADYHTKLHSIKVLTGKTISSAITEALQDYLDDVDVENGSEPA